MKKIRLQSAKLVDAYCKFLIRKNEAVLIVGFLLTLIGGYYSVALFKNLKTDIAELLPENAPSVQDLMVVSKRMGGFNHLSVVVESSDKAASLRFIKDMQAELEKLPKELVQSIETNIRNERDFFAKNKALYLDLVDWEKIEQYVKDRFAYELQKRSKQPLTSKKLEPPQFDFEGMKKKYAERTAGFDKFEDGYFLSRDGRTRVLLARLPGNTTDPAVNEKLSNAAHEIAAKLDVKKYAPDMVVGFDGDVQNMVEEYHSLIEDLVLSTVIVSVLVTIAMLGFFKSIMGTVVLTLSLICGTLWTFGVSYGLVGYLNANTAFMASIVLGNGINFGIIMLARYMEERRKGRAWKTAITHAVGYTSEATWIAALAAGLSYFSLILTDFRGFNQFGIIGGAGMVLCWLSSFTMLPALLIFAEKRRWIKVKKVTEQPIVARAFAKLVYKAYKPIFVLTIISVVASFYFVLKLSSSSIEMDLSKLRSRKSLETGSGFWGKKVDAVFESYLTPTLVVTMNDDDAETVADSLKNLNKKLGKDSPFSEIRTVQDFLPKDQHRKTRIIEDLKRKLGPKILSQLSADDRKLVQELLPEPIPATLNVSDLPPLMTMAFRELDGRIGRIVHLYPKFGETWQGDSLINYADRIREGIRLSGVPAFIAGQTSITVDMIRTIKADGPKATLFAFLSVIVLVLFIYRNLRDSSAVIGALFLGVLWMGAIMEFFALKINFLNFIALPITFGIGVDYAVNIFSRFRSDPNGSIKKAIEHSGGAVALCSLTTIIGYGSLLIASNQAFVSFGVLAILGEFTCLIAALVALPSVLKVIEHKKPKPKKPHRRAKKVHIKSIRYNAP